MNILYSNDKRIKLLLTISEIIIHLSTIFTKINSLSISNLIDTYNSLLSWKDLRSIYFSFPKLKKLTVATLACMIPENSITTLLLSHLIFSRYNIHSESWMWERLPTQELKIMEFQNTFSFSWSIVQIKENIETLYFPQLEYIEGLELFPEWIFCNINTGNFSKIDILDTIILFLSKLPKLKYLKEISEEVKEKDIQVWYWLSAYKNKETCPIYTSLEHLSIRLDFTCFYYLWLSEEQINQTTDLIKKTWDSNLQNCFVNLFVNLKTLTIKLFFTKEEGQNRKYKEDEYFYMTSLFISQLLMAFPLLHIYLVDFPYSTKFFLKSIPDLNLHSRLHFNLFSPEFDNYILASNQELLKKE